MKRDKGSRNYNYSFSVPLKDWFDLYKEKKRTGLNTMGLRRLEIGPIIRTGNWIVQFH